VVAMSRYALPLEGFDLYSVWGYDDLDATYFAQLWRNSSDGDGDPDIWLSWFTYCRPISSAAALATMISVRAGASVADVLRALAAARTAPEAADLARLATQMGSAVP
jgi:hypothetical protein